MALALAALTFAAFAPSLRNEFVNWDDDVNLVDNPAYRGLDGQHLTWMFTTRFGGHYQPLTWLSFAVDHAIWQMRPFGHHLTNVVLHALGTVLFFAVAVRLLAWVRRWRRTTSADPTAMDVSMESPATVSPGVLWTAALAAAIFALHPLRVESVAWVTERRDVLSGVFLFACVWAYCRAVDRPRRSVGWLGLAWMFFALSLLSKAAAMTLPVVLLIIDIYPAGRLRQGGARLRGLLLEKVPFLALSVAAAIQAMDAQQSAGAWRSLTEFGVLARLGTAVYGACFYLWKWVAPHELTPLYPLPAPAELSGLYLPLFGAVLLGLLFAALALVRRYPAILAALLCYLVLLAPVSGVAQSGKQLVADRYSYLSLLPIALLAAGAFAALIRRVQRHESGSRQVRLLYGLAGAYLFGLALLTAGQTTVWRNSERLWRQALAVDPTNSVAYVNLGETLRTAERYPEALAVYGRAVELDPDDPKAHNGAGLALLALGRPGDARTALERATALDPQNARYLCNLGYVLAGFGRLEDAIQCYQQAWQLAPRLVEAPRMLGVLFEEIGRYASARAVYEQALTKIPEDPSLRGNLAWLLATCPNAEVRDGEKAVQLARGLAQSTGYEDPWALQTLAAACAEAGMFDEALRFATVARSQAEARDAKALAGELHRMTQQFEAGRPYRSGARSGPEASGPGD